MGHQGELLSNQTLLWRRLDHLLQGAQHGSDNVMGQGVVKEVLKMVQRNARSEPRTVLQAGKPRVSKFRTPGGETVWVFSEDSFRRGIRAAADAAAKERDRG